MFQRTLLSSGWNNKDRNIPRSNSVLTQTICGPRRKQAVKMLNQIKNR